MKEGDKRGRKDARAGDPRVTPGDPSCSISSEVVITRR